MLYNYRIISLNHDLFIMNAYTLLVKPNQQIQLPAICVHCAKPAHQTIKIEKKDRQRVRSLAVPACDPCAKTVNRKSMQEEQRQRMALLIGLGVGLLALATILLFTPVTFRFGVRLMFGISGGMILGTAVWFPIFKSSQKAILPEKHNILQSAQIGEFDHQKNTFIFNNPTFAERFSLLNKSLQMENSNS